MKTARSSTRAAMGATNHVANKPPLFVNDDYNYLINCTDLITTCQEALQENNHCLPAAEHQASNNQQTPQSIHMETNNCDDHHHHQQQQSSSLQPDVSSIRSPSSAASSGLGLSLEEELSSLKYCHSDEEFSSLNSITNPNEQSLPPHNGATSNGVGSYTVKALIAEFIEWLDFIENKLDSVCYCAKIAQDANQVAGNGEESLIMIQSDNSNDGTSRVQNDQQHYHQPSTKSIKKSNNNELQQIQQVSNDFLVVNGDNVDEHGKDQTVIDCKIEIDDCDCDGRNEYSFQPLSTSSKANLILPETMDDWSVILARHEAFQNEYEKIAHQFFKNINQLTKPTANGNGNGNGNNGYISSSSCCSAAGPSSNSGTQNSNATLKRSVQQQSDRCLNLWLKSLEYLTILQKHSGKRCPRHYLASNKSSLLNGLNLDARGVNEPSTSSLIVHHQPPPPPPQQQHHHHHHILLSSLDRKNRSRSNNLLGHRNHCLRSYHNNVEEDLNHIRSNTNTKPNQKVVELRSTGTGGSSVIIQNRRVQTTRQTTTTNTTDTTQQGHTMIGQAGSICDTHSLDGSGSPGADSGVFSSSMDNSIKFEIIQKDIGYSSDADMSDAIEAQPPSSDQNNLRSSRKRQVRRRRTRTSRNRPWSFHSDWSTWDYYQTPFFCSGDHFSNEDLNYHDENIVRKLTEFGENYESWINNELDTDIDLKDIKPAVVIEKPEIEEEPVVEASVERHVERSDVCISTSPVPFLDKGCQVIDEMNVNENVNTTDMATSTIDQDSNNSLEHKSTQTKVKLLVDSSCMTAKSRTPTPEPIPFNHKNKPLNKTKSITRVMVKSCRCTDGGNSSDDGRSYSSIKFYTSIALAGLLSFLIAVTQFSPEIHKTYPRPPPL